MSDLGTAANVAHEVATPLRQRHQAGWIHVPRDSALQTIGRTRVAFQASLLTAALSICLAWASTPHDRHAAAKTGDRNG